MSNDSPSNRRVNDPYAATDALADEAWALASRAVADGDEDRISDEAVAGVAVGADGIRALGPAPAGGLPRPGAGGAGHPGCRHPEVMSFGRMQLNRRSVRRQKPVAIGILNSA